MDATTGSSAPPGAAHSAADLPRGQTILRACADAVGQDLVTRAALAVRLAAPASFTRDGRSVASQVRDAAEVFAIAIDESGNGAGDARLFLVADRGAAALARLTMPEAGERSPQMVADALRACGERAAVTVDRLLRTRSDDALGARLVGAAATDDSAEPAPGTDPDAVWLGESVLVRADGLEEIGLELLCPGTTAERIARCWRTGHAAPADLEAAACTFVSHVQTAATVERVAARLGLEIRAHAPAEAPNPAAIRSGLLIMDVPIGQDRRFTWCSRLKQRRPDVRVLLLVHHPSRTRVLRGCLAHADEILGWPADEAHLAERLHSLIQREGQQSAARDSAPPGTRPASELDPR